jgi:hypothetical protein
LGTPVRTNGLQTADRPLDSDAESKKIMREPLRTVSRPLAVSHQTVRSRIRCICVAQISHWKRWSKIALAVGFILGSYISMRADTVQFLPEVDAYLKVTQIFRVYYQNKDDRDGGDSTQFTTGPSLELYMKPLLKLKRITSFDPDDSKNRALVFEAGYRYIVAPDKPTDNRFVTAVTSHIPLTGKLLITDRSRADLDWKPKFEWRYRNKLTVERTFVIHAYHLIPYIAFEPYYESQYDKWSTTTEFAGCLLPVGKHVEFNPYYEHENDTGGKKNKQENYIGLMVNFFFSVEKKPPASQ